jgi:hypothetical protein
MENNRNTCIPQISGLADGTQITPKMLNQITDVLLHSSISCL